MTLAALSVLALAAPVLGAGTAQARPSTGAVVSSAAAVVNSGIPESGKTLGNPRAPVTLQFFGDLECPICREFAVGALRGIIRKYVRTGEVKIESRAMETATREPRTFWEQQTAALAAGQQRRMWYFVELFLREQREEDSGYVTPAFLEGIAAQIPGLDLARWERERKRARMVEGIEVDEETAEGEGFAGTPAFLVGRTGGRPRRLTEFTQAELDRASVLFDPVINRLLSH